MFDNLLILEPQILQTNPSATDATCFSRRSSKLTTSPTKVSRVSSDLNRSTNFVWISKINLLFVILLNDTGIQVDGDLMGSPKMTLKILSDAKHLHTDRTHVSLGRSHVLVAQVPAHVFFPANFRTANQALQTAVRGLRHFCRKQLFQLLATAAPYKTKRENYNRLPTLRALVRFESVIYLFSNLRHESL